MYDSFNNRFNFTTGLKGKFLVNKFDLPKKELIVLSEELSSIHPSLIVRLLSILKRLNAPISRIDELLRLMAQRYLNVLTHICKFDISNHANKILKEDALDSLLTLDFEALEIQLNQLADIVFNKSNYENATDNNFESSRLYGLIAFSYQIAFNDTKSIKYFSKAVSKLPKCEKKYRKTYLRELGVAYFSNNQYKNAEDVFEVLQDYYSDTTKKDSKIYSTILYYLGWIYHITSRHHKAEKLYSELLNVQTLINETNKLDYSDTLHKLAVLNKTLKKIEKAEEYHHQAVALKENYYGKYHPLVAISYCCLAQYYFSQKNVRKSEKYYQVAIEIFMQTIGCNNDEYYTVLHNLAMINFQLGKYNESEKLYFKSINLKMTQNKRNGITMVSDYYMISLINKALGNQNKYEFYDRLSKETYNKILKSNYYNN